MSRTYPAKAVLKQKLTVDQLLDKLEGLPKTAVIGFEIHTDCQGEPESAILRATYPNGNTILWVWMGFDQGQER